MICLEKRLYIIVLTEVLSAFFKPDCFELNHFFVYWNLLKVFAIFWRVIWHFGLSKPGKPNLCLGALWLCILQWIFCGIVTFRRYQTLVYQIQVIWSCGLEHASIFLTCILIFQVFTQIFLLKVLCKRSGKRILYVLDTPTLEKKFNMKGCKMYERISSLL